MKYTDYRSYRAPVFTTFKTHAAPLEVPQHDEWLERALFSVCTTYATRQTYCRVGDRCVACVMRHDLYPYPF